MTSDKKWKVMLIEDDTYISDMYKLKLESEGFKVTVAHDGATGLQTLFAEAPTFDLVLLDVVMPSMDGFEVLQKIRKHREAKRVPVIMFTNLGQKDSVEKGLALGAADYIIKAHFTPCEVVEKIRNFLQGRVKV